MRSGEIVGLIGPNGAGKTSLIDAVSGFARSTGDARIDGRSLNGKRPHQRAAAGLARTWQGVELFEDLSVLDNVRVGLESVRPWTVLADAFRPNRRRATPEALAVLEELRLVDHAESLPGTLSQGQRKLVGVARAMVTSPKVILLDEPAAGLSAAEGRVLGSALQRVARASIGLLLVEHDVGLVMSLCDRVYVLDRGRLVAVGTPAEVRANPDVRAAYLGDDHDPVPAEVGHV